MGLTVEGRALVSGVAQGELLSASVGLSFWGGVDPSTGQVIDRHHPLCGERLAGRVLAIPSGRGSCTGSGVLLELLTNGRAPAAIIVGEGEQILTLGALVGQMVFERSIPVVQVDRDLFERLDEFGYAAVTGSTVSLSADGPLPVGDLDARSSDRSTGSIRLDERDRAMLAGEHGKAVQVAMRLLVKIAELEGADALIDVSQVHIDGCIYNGPASLRFAELLVEWGGRFKVPATMNSISVDARRWREQGIEPALGEPATALAEAYVVLGARPTYTCAPYLLDTAPKLGEQVGWAESNAVIYANSVLGARTMKYPDYLDACIALTGRAPRAGCHLDEGRRATLGLRFEAPVDPDESFWPLAGYCCGLACGADIPLVLGLEASAPTNDDLRAFGAAFATVSAAPMFHVAGVTPEAGEQSPQRERRIGAVDLLKAWEDLNTARDGSVGLVSLGNPHFSLNEFARLARGVRGKARSPGVSVIVTSGRDVHEAARDAGYLETLHDFGVTCVTDTCWCMLGEPVVPRAARNLMTNSGKYAHYAPGLVGLGVHFGDLARCIDAACTGQAPPGPPSWLEEADAPSPTR